MGNNLEDSYCVDSHREKQARQNPLYNPFSNKWVVNIVEDREVSVIRQNNRHGFISWGWESEKEKISIGVLPERREFSTNLINLLREELLKAGKKVATNLNKKEKLK